MKFGRKKKGVKFQKSVEKDGNSETVLRSLPPTEGTISLEPYLSEPNKRKPTRNK